MAEQDSPGDPVAHLVPQYGEAPLRAVVAAFYTRIPGDDLLGPMYPADDLDGAEERLADFLVQRCGGPPVYDQKRGHPRLRMRHARFPVDPAARDRWVELMDGALAASEFSAADRSQLRTFLAEVATFLINRSPGS